MSKRIMPLFIAIGGCLMVGAALLGDGASSLVAGISVGRGGGSGGSSGNGGKLEGSARATVWKQFMLAQNAVELEQATQDSSKAGVVVTVIQG
ncbi:hypothetical protein ACQ4M3_08045 [Leptolyngbya sp. AN03gr2]|uniref:hypothetical protein n=1 Tax=unclassified Leptolyngbya TaxID=2650499 RepID=UPI003D31A853